MAALAPVSQVSQGPQPILLARRLPSKTSVGVILCRKNAETRRPEALLVHKRYTYAFAEFVHGRYSRGARPGAPRAPHAPGPVAALLDEMSREELLDVYSLSFEQMWYRIWLTHDNRDLFNKKNARFQSAFMAAQSRLFFPPCKYG